MSMIIPVPPHWGKSFERLRNYRADISPGEPWQMIFRVDYRSLTSGRVQMIDLNYYPKPEHIKAARRLQQEQLLEYCEMIADANGLLRRLEAVLVRRSISAASMDRSIISRKSAKTTCIR
jgi:hypothetical protein